MNSTNNALLAGLFFGLWPLFMNRSGLSGNLSALAFSGLVAIVVLPFAWKELGSNMSNVKILMVLAAGLLGGFGVMNFNGGLAKTEPKHLGTFFAIMIVVQTAVPAIYHAAMNGKLTWTQVAGFACAIAAGALLSKG